MAEMTPRADSVPHVLSPVNVLLVDDMADSLLSIQSLLARPGVSVLIAGSAATALKLLELHEVALAILDVQMPEVNGFELADRMRLDERYRVVPIIFLTGLPVDPSRTFHGYRVGAVDFLVKPVDPTVLESKVRFFVELFLRQREVNERNAELQRLLQLSEAKALELRKAHSNAVELANADALTGVSNRRHILQLGEATLADRRQQAQPLSLAVVDLDHFKAVNDTYGHQAGDSVLRGFCSHVNQQIRPSHRLGRIGGEEFLLLMPGTSLGEAEVILERLHKSLKPHAGVSYTFSAGVAQAGAGEGLHAVIERADAALYEAKRAGRDRSVTSPAPL